MNLAGTPANTELEGIFLFIIEPAPITTLSPISTPFKIIVFIPINTLFPIVILS